MDPGARGLTTGIQPLERGAPAQVGAHAPARVVLGGRDGEQLGRWVETELAAALDDRREALVEELRTEVAAVEEDVVGARLAHPVDDRAGHDVARGEVGHRVTSLHEAVARPVDEERALAADRLGDERLLPAGALTEPQHGRVELDELEVRELGPGPERRRHPVARRDGRVGRRGVDLAEATGREDDGPGVGGADPVDLALADDVEGDAADPARRRR